MAKKVLKRIICLLIIPCFIYSANPVDTDLTFKQVFEAYRWLGDKRYDERRAKIMSLLHNYKGETMTMGVDYVTINNYTTTFSYVAICKNACYKDFEFVPTADEHYGVAYIDQVDEYSKWHTSDSLKIYFPDSIQARFFIDEATNLGAKFVSTHTYGIIEEYMQSREKLTKGDKIYLAELYDYARRCEEVHAVALIDTIVEQDCYFCYSMRLLRTKDKNVVIIHHTP